MNIQDGFPLGSTGLISLQSKGLSRVFSKTTVQKRQFFSIQPPYGPTLTSNMSTGKTIALTRQTFVSKVMSLLFKTLSRFAIAFLPRSKRLLIMAAVTTCSESGAQENKFCHCFRCFPSICHEVMGQDVMVFVFQCWVLSQLFHSPLSLSSRGSIAPLCFLP